MSSRPETEIVYIKKMVPVRFERVERTVPVEFKRFGEKWVPVGFVTIPHFVPVEFREVTVPVPFYPINPIPNKSRGGKSL